MKKIKYKDQNKKNYKKIIIVLFVMIFILLLVNNYLSKLENDDNQVVEYDQLSSIKDVIEFHKSKYISENLSEDDDFYLDVYVKFTTPLYDGDKSNEDYYNTLIEDGAKVLGYSSYKLIDKQNGITIKVICSNYEVYKIIINDREDYFIYMDSQISLKKYEEIPITNFSIQSDVLQRCVNNDWKSDVDFGTRDSIFNGYNIYFDEGVEVRIINGLIYNIVFTEKYLGNVIEDLTPVTGNDYIQSTLGKPTFEDSENSIIGYKGEKMYVFFTGNEISIYINSQMDSDEFFDLTDIYISGDMDLLEFMNELTYMWPDYNEYIYDKSTVYISYPLKGIEISINYGDINGILVYNNNKSTLSKITRYLENTIFVSRLQTDLVFEAERKRILNEKDFSIKCEEYENTLDKETKKIIGESLNYKIYPKKDSRGYISKIYFISRFDKGPNRELSDGVDSYLWINNDYFLFSKKDTGIFFYNLKTGLIQRVLTGKGEFVLKSYTDGILKYDSKEMEMQIIE